MGTFYTSSEILCVLGLLQKLNANCAMYFWIDLIVLSVQTINAQLYSDATLVGIRKKNIKSPLVVLYQRRGLLEKNNSRYQRKNNWEWVE